MITLDPKARSLSVDVAEAELALRRAAWQPRPRKPNTKGVLNNYARHVHRSTLTLTLILTLTKGVLNNYARHAHCSTLVWHGICTRTVDYMPERPLHFPTTSRQARGVRACRRDYLLTYLLTADYHLPPDYLPPDYGRYLS